MGKYKTFFLIFKYFDKIFDCVKQNKTKQLYCEVYNTCGKKRDNNNTKTG